MKKSIFRSICIVAIAVFLAALALIMGVQYSYFSEVQHESLKKQTELAAVAVENGGLLNLENEDLKDLRLTLIDSEGNVVYDSQSDADNMENHLERSEIKDAMKNGYGESSRYSSTLLERQIYSAKKLQNGGVLRLSETHYSAISLIMMMTQPIIIVIFIALGLSLLLASRLSARIVKPLNELDLDKPVLEYSYEEIRPLIDRVISQKRQLRNQAAELKRKQEEFNSATSNMNEGIVLLNENGIILSINHAASQILSVSRYCIGKDILLVNNSFELQELLDKAQNGEHSDILMNIGGLEYQINASPVISEDRVAGITLIIFDITEKEKAEQMRREFSANVSHELKSPLHSISGYAELLKNGMVKNEDVADFSSRIYSEAQRMISLVEDIIRLSRLDEGSLSMKKEKADILELTEKTVDSLRTAAESKSVTVSVNGESSVIDCYPQLLNGIVYNLLDNAIKYNHENGSVDIDISRSDGYTVLKVSDTGIGIPEEHRERVFERFYRVDKSHSKAVGGTGLGLSIVKHAARIHRADINIESVPGGGTTITVSFPENAA